jgi:hypothetical protein
VKAGLTKGSLASPNPIWIEGMGQPGPSIICASAMPTGRTIKLIHSVFLFSIFYIIYESEENRKTINFPKGTVVR